MSKTSTTMVKFITAGQKFGLSKPHTKLCTLCHDARDQIFRALSPVFVHGEELEYEVTL